MAKSGSPAAAVIVLGVVFALWALQRIDTLSDQVKSLQGEIIELQIQAGRDRRAHQDVVAAVEEVLSMAEDLSGEVDRFGYEDWRYVVPSVQDLAATVAMLADEAQSQAANLR